VEFAFSIVSGPRLRIRNKVFLLKEKHKLFNIADFLLRRYLELADALGRRHKAYNYTLDELYRLEQEDAFIISPSEDIGALKLVTRKELQYVYKVGVKDANDNLEAVKDFLI
jgi:predicted patatin/cPLA2 family phospholipase